MDKKCKNCIKDDIGCNVIKQLRKEVLKIKVNRSYLHIIALFICALGLFVAGLFAFRTFCPAPSAKNVVYNIKISGEKNISGDVKAEIKKELAEALIEVENRAVAAYNEKFTILLTVLTIFGIAWPLVVAILQLRFNEGELTKIKEAEEKATTANELANDMKKSMEEFEGRMNTSFTAQLDIQNAIQESSQEIEQLKIGLCREISIIYSELGTVCVLNLKQISNLNEAFVRLIIDMGFSSLKYVCQLGDTPDAALELINCVYTLKTPLFSKKENQDYLNKKWEKLNKEQLKNICTDEQYQALEKMCSVENKKAPGDSK